MQLVREYIKKEDFQMKEPQKNQEKGIRTRIVKESERERERERSVHPCARTSSSGKIVNNHLYT